MSAERREMVALIRAAERMVERDRERELPRWLLGRAVATWLGLVFTGSKLKCQRTSSGLAEDASRELALPVDAAAVERAMRELGFTRARDDRSLWLIRRLCECSRPGLYKYGLCPRHADPDRLSELKALVNMVCEAGLARQEDSRNGHEHGPPPDH